MRRWVAGGVVVDQSNRISTKIKGPAFEEGGGLVLGEDGRQCCYGGKVEYASCLYCGLMDGRDVLSMWMVRQDELG